MNTGHAGLLLHKGCLCQRRQTTASFPLQELFCRTKERGGCRNAWKEVISSGYQNWSKGFHQNQWRKKNVNNPERKDSESQGCMWLCNDMSPDQKWTLWKMDTRDKTQNIVWIWSHLSLIGTCGACFFRALVAFMNIIVPIKSACIISKLILWWTLSWSFLPLSKEK